MKILGLVGWSGSGKTTLVTRLIPCLQARGLRVSTIKHAHHRLELDQPGKDSFRHRQAGAHEVILANDSQFALFHAYPAEPSGLAALLQRLEPVDLVLVEGFRNDLFPKLEVHRPSLGKAPLWPEMDVLAVASDASLPDCPHRVLPLDQPAVIADYIVASLAV